MAESVKVIIYIDDFDNIDFYQEELAEKFQSFLTNKIESTDFSVQVLDIEDYTNADISELEQYRSIGTVEDFQRLVTAKNEGRLVELPCKVGDKLYQGYSEGIDDAKINEIVIEIRTDMGVFEPSDIGKTVFLTREQAEKKLAEGKGK